MQGFGDRLVIRLEITDREVFERSALEAYAANGGVPDDFEGFSQRSDAYKLFELLPDVEQCGVYVELEND